MIYQPNRVIVRKNSTGSEYSRRRVNLIEGTGVTLSVVDDSASGEVNVTITASGGSGTIPSGAVMSYAGSAAPSGWLLCYGQSVSRTTYADLFTAISTTYGAVNEDSFSLPDMRGRAAFGKDNMGGSSASRLTSVINGATLGATGGAETHTLTTAQMPNHSHNHYSGDVYIQTGTGAYGSQGAQNVATSGAGGGEAHNNMPPAIILNYIIKT